MKTRTISNPVIFFAIGLLLVFIPALSHAEWKDRSGELPGMQDEKDNTPLIIAGVGAVVVLGGLVFLAVNKKKKADDTSDESLEKNVSPSTKGSDAALVRLEDSGKSE